MAEAEGESEAFVEGSLRRRQVPQHHLCPAEVMERDGFTEVVIQLPRER